MKFNEFHVFHLFVQLFARNSMAASISTLIHSGILGAAWCSSAGYGLGKVLAA